MLSRRQFIGRSSAAAVSVLAPSSLAAIAAEPRAQASALLRGGRFSQGVLSGDPTPTGITLMTVIDEVSRAGSVRLEVARDPDFKRVVARRKLSTRSAIGHSVKARIGGLDPHERYWYRFETRDRESPVGRFQTALPEDSNETVRFAFFSCADWTHGFYNAYERMRSEDVDFIVCLGDYIYSETYHSRKDGTGVRDDRTGRTATRQNRDQNDVTREAITLADYRDKYALYRSDPALRKLHARFPMISTWDDHEVQDNYAGGDPKGGLEAYKRYSQKRRAAAQKAFFENMPMFAGPSGRIYGGRRMGSSVDLIMLDERRYRADQPCGDAVVPPCAGYDAPRDFLGRTQMDFLKGRLSSSGATWKVIGNQVMAMPAKVTGGSFFHFDSWQGYAAEREELLTYIRDRQVPDVVFVTGDIHTFIAGDVRTNQGDGDTVALEFVGGSITSIGLGEMDFDAGNGTIIKGNDRNPRTDPAIINALRGFNPWVDQADFDHHGYGVVKASPTAFDVTFRRMSTIKKRSRETLSEQGFHYTVGKGQKSIKGVNGPAS